MFSVRCYSCRLLVYLTCCFTLRNFGDWYTHCKPVFGETTENIYFVKLPIQNNLGTIDWRMKSDVQKWKHYRLDIAQTSVIRYRKQPSNDKREKVFYIYNQIINLKMHPIPRPYGRAMTKASFVDSLEKGFRDIDSRLCPCKCRGDMY